MDYDTGTYNGIKKINAIDWLLKTEKQKWGSISTSSMRRISTSSFRQAHFGKLNASQCGAMRRISTSSFRQAHFGKLNASQCGAMRRIATSSFRQAQCIAFRQAHFGKLNASQCGAMRRISTSSFRQAHFGKLNASQCGAMRLISTSSFRQAQFTTPGGFEAMYLSAVLLVFKGKTERALDDTGRFLCFWWLFARNGPQTAQCAGCNFVKNSCSVHVKGVPYINPEKYLFPDQKRKLGLVKRIKKQIDNFGLTYKDLEISIAWITVS